MQLLINKGDFEIIARPPNASETIKEAGCTCYQSEQRTTKSPEDFVKMLKDKGHWSMFDHVSVTVHFKNVSRGLCYDDQTEVLTKAGWKLFKDTTNEDEFLTFNTEDFKNSYQKRTEYTEEIWNDYLIYGQSSMVDFAVTPNHNMWYFPYDVRKNRVWKQDKAQNIYKKRIKLKRGLFRPWEGSFNEENLKLDGITKILSMPNFFKFLGLFWTDGSVDIGVKSGSKIHISQTKKQNFKEIEDCITSSGLKFSKVKSGFSIYNTRLTKWLNSYLPTTNTKTTEGNIPDFIKQAPSNLIRKFIEGAVLGDGTVHKHNGHTVIYTASKDFANDLQELILKAGLCSTIRTINRIGEKHKLPSGQFIETKRLQYVISITTRTNDHLFNKQHWSKRYYNGKVYCVTVPNHTLFVRRNGKAFWSMNTHELVRHRLAAFAQESTRYVDPTQDPLTGEPGKVNLKVVGPPHKDLSKIFPVTVNVYDQDSIKTGEWNHRTNYDYDIEGYSFTDMVDKIEQFYKVLRTNGWSQEDARQILPIGTKSDIVMTADLTEWYHVFKLRTQKAAHWEIRTVMNKVLLAFQEIFPSVFDDFIKVGDDKNGVPYYKVKGYVGDINKMIDEAYAKYDNSVPFAEYLKEYYQTNY